MTTIEKLAVKHPYYCSDSNFYSNEPSQYFESLADFLDEFEDADPDLNLCFRWDINRDDESGEYSANIFLILQRKGIFKPCSIEKVDLESIDRFNSYLEKHWELLKELWKPIS